MNFSLARLKAAYDSHTEPESQRFLAETVWYVMLALLASVCVIACVWGALRLNGVFAALEQPSDISRIPAPPLDRAALGRAIDTAAARAAAFKAFSSAPAADADPAR